MAKQDAYLFYEAGQAVAAAHLGLKIRHVSSNPAERASDIVVPRTKPKARIILWLTGMAAEKKGVGRSDPLRRTRNRARLRTKIEGVMAELTGSSSKRLAEAKSLVNQAQDRANAICSHLYPAIEETVALLRRKAIVTGGEIEAIVKAVKERRGGEAQIADKDGDTY